MIFFAFLSCLLLPKTRKTQKKNGSRRATYASCLYYWRHQGVTTKAKMASPEMPVLKVPLVVVFCFQNGMFINGIMS